MAVRTDLFGPKDYGASSAGSMDDLLAKALAARKKKQQGGGALTDDDLARMVNDGAGPPRAPLGTSNGQRTTPWDTGAPPVAYHPQPGGVSQGQADGLAQFARDYKNGLPDDRDGNSDSGSDSGNSGTGAALASIASQMGLLRDQVGQKYDQGSAALVRAALGGRNSINDAGSAMQKALGGIKGDAMKEQGKVGGRMKKELATLLARQDADQGRSQDALSLRGAYDPSVNALFQSNDMALRSQAQNNQDYQSRLMQVFGQEMSGREATGKQITGGALSTLSNNEEMQRAALESERTKALSDLLMEEQQAQAAARSGGGGRGGGGSRSSSGDTLPAEIDPLTGLSKVSGGMNSVENMMADSWNPASVNLSGRNSKYLDGLSEQQQGLYDSWHTQWVNNVGKSDQKGLDRMMLNDLNTKNEWMKPLMADMWALNAKNTNDAKRKREALNAYLNG